LGEQYSLYAEKTGFSPAVAIGPRAREKPKARDRELQSCCSIHCYHVLGLTTSSKGGGMAPWNPRSSAVEVT
jgi:hypothetical protein